MHLGKAFKSDKVDGAILRRIYSRESRIGYTVGIPWFLIWSLSINKLLSYLYLGEMSDDCQLFDILMNARWLDKVLILYCLEEPWNLLWDKDYMWRVTNFLWWIFEFEFLFFTFPVKDIILWNFGGKMGGSW